MQSLSGFELYIFSLGAPVFFPPDKSHGEVSSVYFDFFFGNARYIKTPIENILYKMTLHRFLSRPRLFKRWIALSTRKITIQWIA